MSTDPSFDLTAMRQRAEAAEKERDALSAQLHHLLRDAALVQVGAQLDWMHATLKGEPVSDFATSFVGVRLCLDLRAERDGAMHAVGATEAELARVMAERDAALRERDAETDRLNDLAEVVWHALDGPLRPAGLMPVKYQHATDAPVVVLAREVVAARDAFARDAAAEAVRAERLREAADIYLQWAETTCGVPRAIDASTRLLAALALTPTVALAEHDAARDAQIAHLRADNARLAAAARRAPIHPSGTVAWKEHLRAWEAYRTKYGHSQSAAETIAERGGFSYREITALLGHAPQTWEPL